MAIIEWEFQNDDGDSIEVEAEGWEEASNLMFGDGEYDYNEWRLVAKDGVYFNKTVRIVGWFIGEFQTPTALYFIVTM